MLITEQFHAQVLKNPSRPALHYLGKDITYQELKKSVSRLSYLYQNELGPKKRVALFARNSPAWISTFFALTHVRAVTIPLNPEAPREEILSLLKETEATHLAVTSDLVEPARDLLKDLHPSIPLIEIEKKVGGEYDVSFTAPADHQPKNTDPILLIKTAGYNGKARLVSFTHAQLIQAGISLRGAYRLSPADRICSPMSWAHPFSFSQSLLLPLLNGSTCVIDHGLQGKESLAFLLQSKTSRLAGSPQLFEGLLNAQAKLPPTLKMALVGWGSLPPKSAESLRAQGVSVSHCYGQAENLWSIAIEDPAITESSPAEPPYFCALGLPGLQYKVLDENGDLIEGTGSRTGLLAVTGKTLMQGYLGLEKETKNALRGSWLYTGDIAQLEDQEGADQPVKLTFLGRKEDLFLESGFFYVPRTRDGVVRAMKGVQDAALFVVKNQLGKTVVACAVVKAPGFPLQEKQIQDACRGKMEPELIPTAIVFTDFIPRDGGGNVHGARLRGQFTGVI